MRTTGRSVLFVLLALGLLSAFPAAARAKLTGQQIMTRVDEREEGKDQVSLSIQRLINKRGQERRRESIYILKKYDGAGGFDEKLLIFMQKPAQVKGTSFLNWSYTARGKDDDQWIYLPALRKVRRLSASDKEDYFMGTDMTYDDMGDRQVDEDTHTLIKTEKYKGKDCYVVKSIPKKKDYMYSKKISWIEKGTFLLLKTLFYDRKKRELKTLTMSGWRKQSGIWVMGEMKVANKQTGHKTIIEIKKTKLNVGVPDRVFTEATAKRGLRKRYF